MHTPYSTILVPSPTGSGKDEEVDTFLAIKETLEDLGRERRAAVNGFDNHFNSCCCFLTCFMTASLGILCLIPVIFKMQDTHEFRMDDILKREAQLLANYFSVNNSVKAYRSYKEFVQGSPLFYGVSLYQGLFITDNKVEAGPPGFANWLLFPKREADWVARLLKIAPGEVISIFNLKNKRCAPDSIASFSIENLALYLLICLPRIKKDSAFGFDLNLQVGGFTYLQGLAVGPETNFSALAIHALLDAGADIYGKTPVSAQISERSEQVGDLNALQLAQRFGRASHVSTILAYLQSKNPASAASSPMATSVPSPTSSMTTPMLSAGVGFAPTASPIGSARTKDVAVAEKFLNFILRDPRIEPKVTEKNKAQFIQAGLEALKSSPHWSTFAFRILSVENYETMVYSQFKDEVKRSIADFGIKIYPDRIDFYAEELAQTFNVAVLKAGKEFDAADERMAARRTAEARAGETHGAARGPESVGQAVFRAAAVSATKAVVGQALGVPI